MESDHDFEVVGVMHNGNESHFAWKSTAGRQIAMLFAASGHETFTTNAIR